MVLAEETEARYLPMPFHTYRGHKLAYLVMAMGWGNTPGSPREVAQVFRTRMESKLTQGSLVDRKYAADVIGPRGEYAQQREREFKNQLERFVTDVQNKPNEKFAIVEGMPDALCGLLKACGHGDHCTRRSHSEYGGHSDALKADGNELSFFLSNARKMGLASSIHVEMRRMKFDDGSEEMVRVAHTTVDTARRVLFATQLCYGDDWRRKRH